MPRQYDTSLDALIKKHAPDTHHIRLKAAPAMFHHLCGKMSQDAARAVTCELLQITPLGLEVALHRDRNNPDHKIIRDHHIITMRAAGASYERIQARFGLSRVQVWRVLRENALRAKKIGLKSEEISQNKLENDETKNIYKKDTFKSNRYTNEIPGIGDPRKEKSAEISDYLN